MTNVRLTQGPLVVAIDSSTTATKAIIVDAAGNMWDLAKRDIPLLEPGLDQYEHDPLLWWTTSKDAIGEVLSRLSPSDRSRVAAIGITHQRESFAPFTKEGLPLRNGILWLDGRATKQIRKYGSSRVHELSGKPAGVTPGIYKMAWVKENEPEAFERADKIVDVSGYITFNLTGNWASSVACADSLGLLDIEEFDYSDELLGVAGVRRDQMAELVTPTHILGNLRPALVAEWSLSESIPVIAGLGDGQAAGIGAAAVTPETAFLNLGTAVNAGVSSPTYSYDPVFRTHVSGIPAEFVFEVLQSSGSFLATWFRREFGVQSLQGAPDPELENAAAAIAPGSEGLITLPYWNAVQSPYWDSVARGATVGWRGIHTKAHMYRSILESIGYEMRLNLNSIEEGTGIKLTNLRATGGGTKSPLWRQIMADTAGLPIKVCNSEETSALGAAVVAMAAIGAHGTTDVKKSAEEMVQLGETIEPDMEKHLEYEEMAVIQRQLYPQLTNVFEELHDRAATADSRAGSLK